MTDELDMRDFGFNSKGSTKVTINDIYDEYRDFYYDQIRGHKDREYHLTKQFNEELEKDLILFAKKKAHDIEYLYRDAMNMCASNHNQDGTSKSSEEGYTPVSALDFQIAYRFNNVIKKYILTHQSVKHVYNICFLNMYKKSTGALNSCF